MRKGRGNEKAESKQRAMHSQTFNQEIKNMSNIWDEFITKENRWQN